MLLALTRASFQRDCIWRRENVNRQDSWTAEGRFSQFLAPTQVHSLPYEMIDSMCIQQHNSEHSSCAGGLHAELARGAIARSNTKRTGCSMGAKSPRMREARTGLVHSQHPVARMSDNRRDVWASLVFTGHMRYLQGPGLSRWPQLLAAAERGCGLTAMPGQYVPARLLV